MFLLQANVVYKSLEPYNIHMQIKLVDIIIATVSMRAGGRGACFERVYVYFRNLHKIHPGDICLQNTSMHSD